MRILFNFFSRHCAMAHLENTVQKCYTETNSTTERSIPHMERVYKTVDDSRVETVYLIRPDRKSVV